MIIKLLTYLKNHKAIFFLGILLGSGTILAGIGLMTTSGYLISRAAQRPMIVDLFVVTAGVRFFGISRAVIRYFERVVSHDLTFRILYQMRSELYRRFDAFSHQWLMGYRYGDLLSGVVTDIETLQNVYLRIISPALVAVIIASFTFTGLALFDVKLGLAALALLILNGIVVPYLMSKSSRGRGFTEVQARTQTKIFLADQIPGIQELTWMGQKRKSVELFNRNQGEIDKIQLKNGSSAGYADGWNSLLSNLGMFFILILAVPLVINGEIEGVWLAALTLGVLSSFEAVQGLANAMIHYEKASVSSKRLYSFNGVINDQQKPFNTGIVINKIETIHLEKLRFSYNKEKITLDEISLSLKSGTKTAIVGPTGSGKSSLLNIILGFWQPNSGAIKIDNQSLGCLDLDSYRTQFGVMAQDSHIFNRSIRQNLLIANPSATDEQISRTLMDVGLIELAENLNFLPGNMGMRLSGGQRQLLSLARVMIKQPQIWVLDEPTANMDVNTEKKILELVDKNVQNKTLLLITHRLTNMERMDQIIVLDRGKIIENGTHDELIRKNGFYFRMYNLQQGILFSG